MERPPTVNVLCKSFLQDMIGICLSTAADRQVSNCSHLLSTLPPEEENSHHCDGPMMSCDQGYRKEDFIEMLAFQVIAAAATVGSRHPIIILEEAEGSRRQ